MSVSFQDSPTYRRARRILLMVHELHKRGYQKLRVSPGHSPSGAYWRCAISPASNFFVTNGAMCYDQDISVHYSTADENVFFGWHDAKELKASQLADLFQKRNPEMCLSTYGLDFPYAGWYTLFMGFVDAGILPVAYSENMPATEGAMAESEGRVLPFPPAGEFHPRQ